MSKPKLSLTKKLLSISLLYLLFLTITLLSLLLIRSYTYNTLNTLQTSESDITNLQQEVESNASSILKYESLINSLEQTSTNTIYLIILIPIILFLLFTLLQYITWKIIKEKSSIKDFKKDFLKFLIGNLIFLTILGFLIYFSRFNLVLLLILSFVWFFALIIYYLNFENLKKIKFNVKTFLLIFLLFLIYLIILFIFLYAYIKIIANDKNFWFLLWLILILPLKSLIKIFLHSKK